MLDVHFRTGTMPKELGKLKKWLKYSRLIVMEYVKSSVCKENSYSSAQIELIFYPLIKLLKVNKMYFCWCNESRIQSTNFKKCTVCTAFKKILVVIKMFFSHNF